MGRLDAEGFAPRVGIRRVPGRHRRRRGSLVPALLAIALLCCLFGSVAPASAAPPDSSPQVLWAMLAVQQAQLVATDGSVGDYFGHSVALYGDTALVGAYAHATVGATEAGAAYVFVRSGATWTWQRTLTADDGAASDWFGWSVALSGDTALVSAPWHATAGGTAAGAAYVFVRSGITWTQQQEVIADDGAALDHFGNSAALSGETALVGAPLHDKVGGADAGAAYAFVRSGTTWSQQQKLSATDGAADDQFGNSVALSGETALAGAPNHAVAGKAGAGAAYVFVRSGTAWTKQKMLSAADANGDDVFGTSVALDGDTALVGAPSHDIAGKDSAGASYVFARSGTTWSQQAEPIAADNAAYDGFGGSVALAGSTALVGAQWDHTAAGDFAGSAYAFLLTPQPKPHITKLAPASGKRGVTVTITGTGFGTKHGTSFVKFGAGKCTKYVSWSATSIRCKVPAKAKLGTLKVEVTTSGGTSNAKSFKVKP